jgi:methylated-DNA-[protein]-cysteine S-methyltransferase
VPPALTDSLERRLRAVRPAVVRPELGERAAAAGLLDVAFATLDAPVGGLLVAVTPAGVVRVAFALVGFDAVLSELASRVSPRVLEAPARLDAARRELEEYFDGRRTAFSLPLDWRLTRGFRGEVLRATARIPFGQTGTYRSVATAAGSPGAVRAAGTALATNPLPIVVPCHRVLRTDGTVGGYRGGASAKQALLRLEAATSALYGVDSTG